jgi:hypothetical protein
MMTTFKKTSGKTFSRGLENSGGTCLVPFEVNAISKSATQPMTATER